MSINDCNENKFASRRAYVKYDVFDRDALFRCHQTEQPEKEAPLYAISIS